MLIKFKNLTYKLAIQTKPNPYVEGKFLQINKTYYNLLKLKK